MDLGLFLMLRYHGVGMVNCEGSIKNGARARVSGQLYRSLGVSLWVYLTILPEAHLRTDVGQ